MADAGPIPRQTICDAIAIRHLLAYASAGTGETRIVEPHACGVTDDDHDVALSWRRLAEGAGEWELVRLDEMRAVRILSVTFGAPRPGYNQNDTRLREIYAQL
jgi:hypothetical protein